MKTIEDLLTWLADNDARIHVLDSRKHFIEGTEGNIRILVEKNVLSLHNNQSKAPHKSETHNIVAEDFLLGINTLTDSLNNIITKLENQ